MSDAVGETVVQHARDAASRGDWRAAFELFMKADADGGLAGPGDLGVLGEVAHAAGHLDVTIEAWVRALSARRRLNARITATGTPRKRSWITTREILDGCTLAAVGSSDQGEAAGFP
jgi:hypothetical protein